MDEALNKTATVGASEPAMGPRSDSLASPPADEGPTRDGRPRGSSRTSGRLFVLLLFLIGILAGPYVVGQFVYHIRYSELQAGVDVATGGLAELKPRLSDFELASRLIAQRVEPSVVSVFRPGDSGREGQGSGVIIDTDGYIITNFHVVNGADRIQVHLSDGRRAAASVVGADPMTDLAVLKIDLPNLIAAEWGDSDQLQVGDLVWALGSPYGLDRSLTFGIVSAKARRSGSYLSSPYQEYLQTDAALNPGNSGGPLVNIEGNIIGINAAIFGSSYRGISFAIPSTLAREKYDELREKGWIDRAWLGIRPTQVPDQKREQLALDLGEGVYVGAVESGTPAERAGLRTGDVILKWNDHQATDPTLLSRAISTTEIGSTAKVLLARTGPRGNDGRVQLEIDVDVERAPWAIAASRGGE